MQIVHFSVPSSSSLVFGDCKAKRTHNRPLSFQIHEVPNTNLLVSMRQRVSLDDLLRSTPVQRLQVRQPSRPAVHRSEHGPHAYAGASKPCATRLHVKVLMVVLEIRILVRHDSPLHPRSKSHVRRHPRSGWPRGNTAGDGRCRRARKRSRDVDDRKTSLRIHVSARDGKGRS